MKIKILIGVAVAMLLLSIVFIGTTVVSLFPQQFSQFATAVMSNGSLIVYNGENASLLQGERSCLSYAEEVTPGRNGSGKALKLMPDPWHASGYSVNCGGQDRLNFSSYSYLEFYIKGGVQSEGTHDFNIVSYYGTSKTVNLLQYVEGGKIDETWRKVSIPVADLKTSTYNLNTVDTIYFGTDSSSRIFFVDDIVLTNTKTASTVAATSAPVEQPLVSLYDGDSYPLLYTDRICVEYASEVSNGRSGKGLKLAPDAYHSPNFKVNCGGRGRPNFSEYQAIEFYLKGDSSNSNDAKFNVVSYFGQSNAVSIKRYIEGGVIDTNWRLVSIPLVDLKTGSYNLSTVDDFYFGTDSSNRTLYLDNLVVTKNRNYVNTTVIAAPVTLNSTVQTNSVPTSALTTKVVTPPITPVVNPAVISVVMPVVVPLKEPYVVDIPEDKDPVELKQIIAQPLAVSVGDLITERYDYDEIDLANRFGQWLYAENSDTISLNFVEKYDVNRVTSVSNYTITSSNDADYSSGTKPTKVSYRWRTLYAPTIRKTDLKVAYRVFLKLPTDLKDGKKYTVLASNLGISTKPFTFIYNDDELNQNIKVNQVGYLPEKNKFAYVGQYTGTGGPLAFDLKSFEVKNEQGTTVYRGTPKFRNIDTNNTGENVYELDFSSLKTAGNYYVYVPGVGKSFTFRIASDVYNEVLGIAMKGAYHERSGTELTREFTRFTHGPAHLKDAIVMDHTPIPSWFRSRFDTQGDTKRKDAAGNRLYYPTNLSGKEIKATKGHYDAGDYGKYVVNGSLFVGNILAGFEAFPTRLMKDDGQIPERGNGIPDLIDEVKWELDWLETMQDPEDGGVFCIVKPDGAIEYYENRRMDDPALSRRLLYPKDTTCTGAYAAALAKAGRSPLIKKFYPTEAARYISKAKKAFEFLSRNPGYLGWHHYGLKDEFDADKSMDERVWASIELFNATGETQYHDFFMAHHKPEYERWGWNTLYEASGQANYACAFSTGSVDKGMKERCAKEIIKAADSHVVDSQNRAYRLSMSDSPLNYRDYTYFFPQERIIQLLIANSINANPQYEQVALYNWDYILGSNPTSYSYITGIGSKRFREAVFTQAMYDDIKAPVSGIPIGMGNNFGYLEVYGSKLAQMYPPNNGGSPSPSVSYPLLKQAYDGYNIGVEFTVPEISENLVSAAYFASDPKGKNSFPSYISIVADKVSGSVPFTVHFKGSATDSDGSIVRYFWDFDDETYSVQQNPVHTFTDPYKAYRVVLTVTDNEGAETFRELLIRTSPASFTSSSDAYKTDANTLALFHFDSSPVTDASNHGYTVKTAGAVSLTSDNVLWMKVSEGKSIAFTSVNDTAVVELPRQAVFANANSTLVAEAKIFVDSYLSENVKSSAIFALEQGDTRSLGLYDAIYVDGTHVKVTDGYSERQQNILTREAIAQLMSSGKMQKGTWFNLKLVIQNGKTAVYVNSNKVAESTIAPNFAASDESIRLKFGGFKGYIDEIRVSNVTR